MKTAIRNDLEDRLRTTFDAHAQRLVVEPGHFAAHATPTADATGDSRRRPIVPVAIGAALIAAITTVVFVVRDPSPSPRRPEVRTTPRPAETSSLPIGVRDVPEGMQLWSYSTRSSTLSSAAGAEQLWSLDGSQDPAGPVMYISVQAASPGTRINPGRAPEATVRGHDISFDPAKDAAGDATEFAWVEDNALIDVIVRGATTARAIEVLDQMSIDPRGAMQAFDPAQVLSGVGLIGNGDPTADGASTDATYVYGTSAPHAGASGDLTVSTSTRASYPGYLRTLLVGSAAGDGRAIAFDSDVGVTMSWRDGRQVVVGPPSLGRSALQRVAESAAPLSSTDETELRRHLNDRLAALPIIGESDVNDIRVVLRGRGEPTAVCVSNAAGSPSCNGPMIWPGGGSSATTSPILVASTVVDSRWFIAAAGAAQVALISQPGGAPSLDTSAWVNATLSTWHLVAGTVPSGIDQVSPTGPANGPDAGTQVYPPISRPPGTS